MDAVVTSGRGIASRSMEREGLDREFAEFGYQPVPGTLNLDVPQRSVDTVATWPWVTERGKRNYRFHPVTVNGYACHVRAHTRHLELVADVHLRDHLNLTEGDTVDLQFRPSLSVRIMAHEKRRGWAEQLSEQVGAPIVWDRHNNVWDTARRAWLDHDPTATHHLVLQDDVIPCDNLRDVVTAMLVAVPTEPLCLTVIDYRLHRARTDYLQAVERGQRWWRSLRAVSALGLVIPVSDIGPMVQAGDRSKNPHDDLKIRNFYREQKRDVWFPIPSVVQHRPMAENPTLVAGNDRNYTDRSAANFCQDPSGIDWTPDRPPAPRPHMPGGHMVRFVNVKTGKVTDQLDSVRNAKAIARFDAMKHYRRVERQGNRLVEVDPTPVEVVPDDVMQPSKAGPGSGKGAWLAYANVHGVEVDEDASRDDIVAACEQAGVA